MAIIGTFNGASVVAMPRYPGFKEIELEMVDVVASTVSPFTGQTQVQSWPGADHWNANITLPQMTQTNASAWVAFFAELRGMANVFELGHPLKRTPVGSAKVVASGIMVSAPANAMGTSIATSGWTSNSFRLLLPGDHIQIGQRLYMVLEQVNSDGNGGATINVWPTLRESILGGSPVILKNPSGMFRLTSNTRSWLTDETRLSGLSFKATEAR